MENRKVLSSMYKVSSIIAPLAIIFFAVVLRLVPHPPNVAPIAALALFGGCYLDKRYALVLPLVAMFVSDFFIGFHDTMLFVYASFLLTGLLGMSLRKHRNIRSIIIITLISSVLFFLITNFGVWLVSSLYPRTIEGLFQSYFFAIPFFRNTIIGDLLYVGLFFGVYELILRLFIRMHPNRISTNKYE